VALANCIRISWIARLFDGYKPKEEKNMPRGRKLGARFPNGYANRRKPIEQFVQALKQNMLDKLNTKMARVK